MLSLFAPYAHRPFSSPPCRYEQAKIKLGRVTEALEHTVPLQVILANAVWLGPTDIIEEFGGILCDLRNEHRWVDKFAYMGSNPLPQADEPALKIGPLNARLNLIKEKVREGNGANSRCCPSPPPPSSPHSPPVAAQGPSSTFPWFVVHDGRSKEERSEVVG